MNKVTQTVPPRLRVVSSFPLGDRRVENRTLRDERAREKRGEGKKSERGDGRSRERDGLFLCFSPTSPPSHFFWPRSTFRTLSHLSRFDSRRDDLLEEKRRLLAV